MNPGDARFATATYADRHISVDIVYEFSGGATKRIYDVTGYTVNLLFLGMFGYAITFKVFDILEAGEISNDLSIPLWTGYTFASLGILAAFAMAAIRWWRVVVAGRGGASAGGRAPWMNRPWSRPSAALSSCC